MDIDALRDMAVVSVNQAEKLGSIEDVLIDVRAHRIGGLLLHGGLFRGGPVINWSSVGTVGQDAVMVEDRAAASTGADSDSGLTRFQTLRNLKVVTDAGALVGTVQGAEVDPADGRILHYTVAAPDGNLLRKAATFSVPPSSIEAVGRDLMTVNAAVIDFQR